MKKKIAFIASHPSSLLNFRFALMQSFIARGYNVIAIAPTDKEVEKTLGEHNIRYIPVDMQRNGLNPLADVALIHQLRRIFLAEKPHATFAYTIKPVIYGSIAARLAGVKYIYSMITGTGYIFTDINFKTRIIGVIASRLFRIALKLNTLIYFQNKDNLNFFRQKGIISAAKPTAVVNGSGVDCQQFLPAAYPPSISFIMIARFLYDKGIIEYIEAARLIKQQYPQVKFHLAGWIDSNPNSITQPELNKWVDAGIIENLGKLADVRPALANASVFVLPSYHEGTPRSVLEAMAMSRPVITTDAPGCRETVIRGENGFLVPVKSIQELVDAMKYFIEAQDKIAVMGEKGRQLALEKYDVNKVNDSIQAAMINMEI